MKHYSVLLNESILGLNIKEDGIYVYEILVLEVHSKEILKRIPKGHLYAFDEDINALNYADNILKKVASNFTLIKSNFVFLKEELAKRNINKIDGILFDLGVSSPQIDNPKRGFSFMNDALLDMRMDESQDLTAYNVVNEYNYNELVDIFFKYGEEKLSKVIAKKIVETRPIKTTLELVNTIKLAVGNKYFNLNHPERKIFQAIRIEVNKELTVLEKVLPDAIDLLKPNGRIVVITFHSLEDRIVKNTFKKYSSVDELVKGLPEIPEKYKPVLKLINKKPILPSSIELEQNSRSKSAKLRIGEKI